MLHKMVDDNGKHINKKYAFKILQRSGKVFKPYGEQVFVAPKNLDGSDIVEISVVARLSTWVFTCNLEVIN